MKFGIGSADIRTVPHFFSSLHFPHVKVYLASNPKQLDQTYAYKLEL